MRVPFAAAAVLAATLIPQAQTAPTYDVTFTTPQGAYTGTTTFAVARNGAVTGAMKITSPTAVNGTLSGTVKGDTWTFDYGYQIPEQGCEGRVSGEAKVSADRKSVKGEATIAGACAPEPFAASFTFTQQAAKK